MVKVHGGRYSLIAGIAVMGILASCGSSPSSAATGKTAYDLVHTATTNLTTKGFSGAYSLKLAIDTSKVTGAGSSLSGIPSTLTATGNVDYVNSKELSLTLNAALLGTTYHLGLRELDGTLYYSLDNGSSWSSASLSSLGSGVTGTTKSSAPSSAQVAALTPVMTQIVNTLENGVTNEGSATVDGVATTHFSLAFTQTLFTSILNDLANAKLPASANMGSIKTELPTIENVLTIGNGSVDEFVGQSSGNLVRESVNLPISINMTAAEALAGSAASSATGGASIGGTLGLTFTFSLDVNAVGSEALVAKPSHVSTGSGSLSGLGL